MDRRFEITAKPKEAVIDIEGVIGYDWWADEPDKNTKENLKKELKAIAEIKASKIVVNINSLGGSYLHGMSIHDILKEHPAAIETRIYGLTASAATIIAMAGDVIQMSDNALMLVHRSSSIAMGNKNDMETMLDDLKKIDERIANVYAKRSGNTKEFHLEQMDKNNGQGEWLTADQAQEMGYADEIFEPKERKIAAYSKEEFMNYGVEMPETKEEEMDKTWFEEKLEGLKNWISENFKTKEDDTSEFDNKVSEIENKLKEVEVANSEELATKDQAITDKQTEIDNLTGEKETLENKVQELEGQISAMNAKETEVKADKDPDPSTDVKPASNPFDAAAQEMNNQIKV